MNLPQDENQPSLLNSHSLLKFPHSNAAQSSLPPQNERLYATLANATKADRNISPNTATPSRTKELTHANSQIPVATQTKKNTTAQKTLDKEDAETPATTAANAVTTTRRITMPKNVPQFLNKLYSMVDDPNSNGLIKWSENGASFLVQQQTEFAKDVLPRFFKHNNFASFVRQLNMYGFHKVPHLQQGVLLSETEEIWEFSNENFRRNQPELLCHVVRKKGRAEDERESHGPDLTNLITEMTSIKQRQQMITSDLKAFRQENQALWEETFSARERHNRHQQTIDKILHFLASVFTSEKEASSIPTKKRRLLLGDGAEHAKENVVEDIAELLRDGDFDGSSARPAKRETLTPLRGGSRLANEGSIENNLDATTTSALTLSPATRATAFQLLPTLATTEDPGKSRASSSTSTPTSQNSTALDLELFKRDHRPRPDASDGSSFPLTSQNSFSSAIPTNAPFSPRLALPSAKIDATARSAESIQSDIDTLQTNIEQLNFQLGLKPDQPLDASYMDALMTHFDNGWDGTNRHDYSMDPPPDDEGSPPSESLMWSYNPSRSPPPPPPPLPEMLDAEEGISPDEVLNIDMLEDYKAD